MGDYLPLLVCLVQSSLWTRKSGRGVMLVKASHATIASLAMALPVACSSAQDQGVSDAGFAENLLDSEKIVSIYTQSLDQEDNLKEKELLARDLKNLTAIEAELALRGQTYAAGFNDAVGRSVTYRFKDDGTFERAGLSGVTPGSVLFGTYVVDEFGRTQISFTFNGRVFDAAFKLIKVGETSYIMHFVSGSMYPNGRSSVGDKIKIDLISKNNRER